MSSDSTVKIRIYISYDGTHYHGWQRQVGSLQTVQEVLENRFSRLLNSKISIQASGRTDAGVHARVQVAHARIPVAGFERFFKHKSLPTSKSGFVSEVLDAPGAHLVHGLNSILPTDIRVLKIDPVASDFHAQRDACRKKYIYLIDQSKVQLPFLRHYSWHLRYPLNLEQMQRATQLLIGTHDFASFCGAGSTVKTTRRTIYKASIKVGSELLIFEVVGSGFLKNMVRSIVGTLVLIGSNKTVRLEHTGPVVAADVDYMQRLIHQPNRLNIGPTAPPHGLWLWDVYYPAKT